MPANVRGPYPVVNVNLKKKERGSKITWHDVGECRKGNWAEDSAGDHFACAKNPLPSLLVSSPATVPITGYCILFLRALDSQGVGGLEGHRPAGRSVQLYFVNLTGLMQ